MGPDLDLGLSQSWKTEGRWWVLHSAIPLANHAEPNAQASSYELRGYDPNSGAIIRLSGTSAAKCLENEFHHADGRWVHVRRQMMENGSSIVMHTDITERKLLEQAKDEFVAVDGKWKGK